MKRPIPFLVLTALLASCSSLPDLTSHLTPFRIDVRQGNFVSQEMAAQLKPGLTREQVRFILGTPLITDLFHADRWDYIYRFQPGHGKPEQRHLAVFFADGKLARLSGDVMANLPAGADASPAKEATRMIEIKADSGQKTKPETGQDPALSGK